MEVNSKNFGAKERSIKRMMMALYGTDILRKNGEIPFVFCKACKVSNDEICMYDQLRRYKDVDANTKYPCGRAYAMYQQQLKQGKK